MRRINKPTRVLFGIGDMGFALMTGMETSFFLLFLTDVAALPLGLAALISTITGIADAVSALIAGVVIDKTHFKWGKYRSWLIIAPPIVMFFFALQFTAIGGDALAATLISIGFIVSHFVWNLVWTAHRSLPSVLTDDTSERAFLSGRIAAGSSIGKLISSKLIPILTVAFAGLFAGGSPVWGYTVTAFLAGFGMLIGYYITFGITKGYDEAPSAQIEVEKEKAETQKNNSPSIGDMLKGVAKNKPLLAVLGFDLLRLIAFYLFLATAAYYAKAMFYDNSASVMGNVLLIANLGVMAGSLLSKNAVQKFGTKKSLILSIIGIVIFLVLSYFIREQILIVYVTVFIGFALFGVGYGLTTSLYVNSATYTEYKTGKNIQGFIMSISSFAIKVSIVLRGLIVTAGLAVIGYTAAEVNAGTITPGVADGAAALCFLVTAALLLISLIPLMAFNLKDEDVAEMSRKIEERKRQEA